MRKSSSRVCETSLESLRKQERPANISTISNGERSSDCCMFCTHVARHSFSVNGGRTEGEPEGMEMSSRFISLCTYRQGENIYRADTKNCMLCVCVYTMYVFHHVDAEAMAGDGGEHLSGTPPPGKVVRRAPGGDGTEQQLEVVLLGQLLRRRHEGAELHQNLQSGNGQGFVFRP